MTGNVVLPFQEDVLALDPDEMLEHLAYLRRTIAKRDYERQSADLESLSEDARKTLAEVAKSDHEILATLDTLEATIRAELDR